MLVGVVQRVLDCHVPGLDAGGVHGLLADAARLQRWLDGVQTAAAGRLRELAATDSLLVPQLLVADAAHLDERPADQVLRRADTVQAMPELWQALADGRCGASHVDVVDRALRRLEPGQRDQLAASGSRVASWAGTMTPALLATQLEREVERLRRDDGLDRFERQRRAVRLRTRRDPASGMVKLWGELDEASGAVLLAAVRQRVEALFHDQLPATAPTDPLERHAHLQGLALVDLITRGGAVKVSMGVIVDHQTLLDGLHERSVIDLPGGVHVPVETLRRWGCDAGILPIVLNGAGLPIDVGREQRLATPAQRWALRAIYPCCAIPGCDAPFQNCTIHHIRWWRRGGSSDLDNMVPVCSRHHHAVHEGGWTLALEPVTRLLTVEYPDGTTRRQRPPPRARAG